MKEFQHIVLASNFTRLDKTGSAFEPPAFGRMLTACPGDSSGSHGPVNPRNVHGLALLQIFGDATGRLALLERPQPAFAATRTDAPHRRPRTFGGAQRAIDPATIRIRLVLEDRRFRLDRRDFGPAFQDLGLQGWRLGLRWAW